MPMTHLSPSLIKQVCLNSVEFHEGNACVEKPMKKTTAGTLSGANLTIICEISRSLKLGVNIAKLCLYTILV